VPSLKYGSSALAVHNPPIAAARRGGSDVCEAIDGQPAQPPCKGQHLKEPQ